MDIFLIVLVFFVPLTAQIYILLTYKKTKKIASFRNGFEVARIILNQNELGNVNIVATSGNNSSQYDTSRRQIYLSIGDYSSNTVKSTAIAALECGHAIQDKKGNILLKTKTILQPIIKIITAVSYWILLLGYALSFDRLIYIGLGFTTFGLIFQLLSLPVELDASSIALKQLQTNNLISNNNSNVYKNALFASSLKYIAGNITSALLILKLIFPNKEQ